ncbi:tRNA uridine-5-carboxymethylaminomethyl(34) synthesis enzyme MnmG [Thermoflavifilum thermophilum]|uniref:tRNA uridine 5-carboxymethylaminomethyl modification enzyme MnmG n=1 Tax=Thermoflavifilum thermophilum TaxID=1393122 RepID=A0A1I7NAS2_9BACT|nr:tRNA uridine-5-carboxymethylaminomethyl(34) synthesis enzyme MnmG [Thermoflavifilum thermophilum]SFV31748.1 tRNA uridine 5-carboxymethylaminomethyl modification enzyme [Thermoflavifilum thermophilum]
MFPKYNVIVVGAGHAGCEAAAAAANLGSSVLLITMNMQNMAQMSCNPAMGGVAKGQIIREIDAMGGYSGIVTDLTTIQFRMLNRSKGPAMWSPRAQNDRMQFSWTWRLRLEQTPRIDFYQDMVKGLLVRDGRCFGVVTQLGHRIEADAVVLTNGTFLNGVIHIGEKHFGGGRVAERAATGITEQLVELGFESGRLKTGTPPRVDGRTLDYSRMEEQKGDEEITGFSFLDTPKPAQQKSCWITYTNREVHEILKTGFDRSPMFQGRIQGVGPRYCPSIEDKINRFADKERHQIFVEPEGWHTIEVYVNGFSTSLPEEVQYKALQKIPGFEHCKMFRPGYAIEYDFFPPTQLYLSLETRLIENLFFAGQINGTTGYEEAACQGLMAGINAHRKVRGEEPLILRRDEAYIGVLIDDLVHKGTIEPYRMFTSRAEFRTLLRQDNADLRLTPLAHRIGLASQERMERVENKLHQIKQFTAILEEFPISPEQVNTHLEAMGAPLLKEKQRAAKLLLRPEISVRQLMAWIPELQQKAKTYTQEAIEQTEIQLKYAAYIEKEKELSRKMRQLEDVPIPEQFNYEKLQALSTEARQKLMKYKPRTLGQASRISGVNPSDIQVLMVYMGR